MEIIRVEKFSEEDLERIPGQEDLKKDFLECSSEHANGLVIVGVKLPNGEIGLVGIVLTKDNELIASVYKS